MNSAVKVCVEQDPGLSPTVPRFLPNRGSIPRNGYRGSGDAASEAVIANGFVAVTTLIIPHAKDSLIPDKVFRMNTNSSFHALLDGILIKALLWSRSQVSSAANTVCPAMLLSQSCNRSIASCNNFFTILWRHTTKTKWFSARQALPNEFDHVLVCSRANSTFAFSKSSSNWLTLVRAPQNPPANNCLLCSSAFKYFWNHALVVSCEIPNFPLVLTIADHYSAYEAPLLFSCALSKRLVFHHNLQRLLNQEVNS